MEYSLFEFSFLFPRQVTMSRQKNPVCFAIYPKLDSCLFQGYSLEVKRKQPRSVFEHGSQISFSMTLHHDYEFWPGHWVRLLPSHASGTLSNHKSSGYLFYIIRLGFKVTHSIEQNKLLTTAYTYYTLMYSD